MEFGPRALGSRSIIGDARNRAMQAKMNLKIKFRESSGPSPRVLREEASQYFELDNGREPLHAPGRPGGRASNAVALRREDSRADSQAQDRPLHRCRRLPTSIIPPASRPWTGSGTGGSYRLIKAFEAKTGCPVMINTSFNVRGEPIVCTPEDAYRCFLATDMDVLVLEDFVLQEGRPARGAKENTLNDYLAQFQLD